MSAAIAVLCWSLCQSTSPAELRSGEPSSASRAWTTADGLPQNSVVALESAHPGELWVGTFAGLGRFDGERFERFERATHPGLSSNRILCLATGSRGELWIGTEDAGLMRIDGGRCESSWGISELSHTLVRDLHLDAQGQLWIASLSGLYLGRERGAWHFERLPEVDAQACSLAEPRPGELLIGTERGLLRRRAEGSLEPLQTPGSTALFALAAAPSGETFAVQQGELCRLAPGGDRLLALAPGAPNPCWALDLRATPEGLEVVAGGAGLVRFELDAEGQVLRRTELETASGMPLVRALCRDAEGSLWVGYDGRGLVRHRPALGTVHRGPVAGVRGVMPRLAGGVWAIDAEGRLLAVEAERGVVERIAPTIDGRPFEVGGLLEEPGALWLGHQGGFGRLRDGEFVAVAPASGAVSHCRVFLRDDAGCLWVGAEEGLVQWPAGGAPQLLPSDRQGLPRAVRALALDGTGRLWVGGDDGLARRAEHGYERVHSADELQLLGVRHLWIDADDRVHVASYGGGLTVIDGQQVRRFTPREGLADTALSGVLGLEGDGLVLLGNGGLTRVERRTLAAVAAGRSLRVGAMSFGESAGVAEGHGGCGPALARDGEGRLWFATVQGALVVEPAQLAAPRFLGPPRLTGVQFGGRSWTLPDRDGLCCPPGGGDLEVRFAAATLLDPARVQFESRLIGYADEWSPPSYERVARFTRVPPGSYRFEVRAAEALGEDGPEVAALELVLPAHWYQSARLQLAVAAALGVLVWFGLGRLRRLRERRRKGRERAARLESLGVLAGGIAHDLNNLLVPVIGFAELVRDARDGDDPDRQSLDRVVEAATRARDLVRSVLDFAGHGRVAREEVDLSALVEEVIVGLRSPGAGPRVTVVHRGSGAVVGDRLQLARVVHNLCLNAQQEVEQRGSRVEITIQSRAIGGRDARRLELAGPGSYVELAVNDDGGGMPPEVAGRVFEPFFTTKRQGRGSGMGLAVVHGIVRAHQGAVELTTEVGAGSTFRCLFPSAESETAAEGRPGGDELQPAARRASPQRRDPGPRDREAAAVPEPVAPQREPQ
jgi:signal transduction histidine kinase/ligand-binding sensor domain-containing protein